MPDTKPVSRYRSTISKEEVSALPTITFGGEIVVIDSARELDKACTHLVKQPLIGFDTESRPAFKKGVVNKIALLQISTDSTCFLFRLCSVPLDKAILKILESKDIIKVGLGIDNDMRELGTLRRFHPRGFVELQRLVTQYGIEDQSLQKIAAIVLDHRISKAQRLTNWEAVKLTDAQKLYAATDAWVCAEIYKKLTGK